MPCFRCKRKGIPINCRFCDSGFCSRCIDLSIHNCSGLDEYKNEKKKILEKQLEFKPKSKINPI